MTADPIRVECIRALYAAARVSFAAALVLMSFLAAVFAIYSSVWIVVAWYCCGLAVQGSRYLLIAAFDRARPDAASIEGWARSYTAHQLLSAALWGATIWIFGDPAEPITIALVLCFLFSIGASAVMAQSFNPPSMVALVGPIFGSVAVRLLATGRLDFSLVGVATCFYAATIIGYCRVQSRNVVEGFRIRFENRDLLDALRVEKTEAERARQEAERSSLAKSQFLAAASHDLRQPLYALSLFSASLDSLTLDTEGRAVLGRIQGSIGAMETLFAGLLDVSRLDAGMVKPRRVPVDVDALFDRLSQTFLPIAQERQLDLRFRCDGEWVSSDETLLEQILSNLVSNALRYTHAGGVLVAARRRGDAIRFEVWDTGRGIAASDHARIFEEFVQIDNPGRDRERGLGLGLSIARRSADLLGAPIDVMSKPGRGSRFAFAQARAAPTASSLHHRQPNGMPAIRRDGAVLVVDDDGDVRIALTDLLRRWRTEVVASADYDEAKALIDAGTPYRLIIADYRLAGAANGLDLLRYARGRLDPAPHCVLVTGDFDPALIKAADEGGVPLFHKPLRTDLLRELVGA